VGCFAFRHVAHDRVVSEDLLLDRRQVRLPLLQLSRHDLTVLDQERAPLGGSLDTLGPQGGEGLHLGDRHARRFQSHHKAQPFDIGRRVKPVSRFRTRYGPDEPSLLVIAQCVRRDAERFGHTANRECFRHDNLNFKTSSAL
jgi:hypothetical protein